MTLILPRSRLDIDFARMAAAGGDAAFYPDELSKLDPLIILSRSSPGTRTNAAGVIETIPAGHPRFEFDPATGSWLGVLIEEQRTNRIPTSVDLSGYNTFAATMSAGVPSDLGGLGYKIQETADNAFHFSGLNYVGISGTGPFAASVSAKAVERRYLQLGFDNGSTTVGGYANFDLLTGAVVATGGYGGATVRAYVQAQVNGFYRCAILVSTIGGSSSGRLSMLTVLDPGAGIFTPHAGTAGHGLYVQYPQVEEGACPTTYIPTTVGPATRIADHYSSATLSPYYRQGEGTLLFDVARFGFAPLQVLSAGGLYADINNRIDAVLYPFGSAASDVLTNIYSINAGVALGRDTAMGAPFDRVRMAISFSRSANQCVAYVNGTLQAGGTSAATVPAQVTNLLFGTNNLGGYLNGILRSVHYRPTTTSALTLKARSTP